MAYESNLYIAKSNSGLATDLGAEALGAPILIPGPGTKGSGVNIHQDYPWTLSTKEARNYVPKLMLTEYKLVLSSEVAGMLYALRGAEDNVNVIARQAGENIVNITGAGLNTVRLSRTGQTVAGVAGAVPGAFNTAVNSILGFVTSAVEKESKQSGVSTTPATAEGAALALAQRQELTSSISGQGLGVYKGLYAIEPTGWGYVMPYLGSANMMTPNNAWGEGTQMKQALAQGITGVQEIVAGTEGAKAAKTSASTATKKTGPDIFSMLAGAYKVAGAASTMALAVGGGLVASESPQSFTGTGTDSIECSFYLYNTQELADIRKNWEFCYLFTYQNLANRKGINLLDPPCLYRALIPGYKQLPICWITGLSIVNIGSTKLIDITTGNPVNSTTQGGPNIKMIPEAYKISFTLESALKNSRNIFQYAADPSGVVSVSFSKE